MERSISEDISTEDLCHFLCNFVGVSRAAWEAVHIASDRLQELQDEYNKLAAENYYLEIKLEKAIAGIKVMRDGSDAMCLIHARELLDYLEEDG